MNGANTSRWLLRALAVIVLAAAAVFAWNATRPAPVAVVLAAAESGRVETTVANTRAGSVSACRRAKLATPLGGRIERLAVREGDRVKEGQLLLVLWNDDLLARERVSREQLDSASARVREACLLADNAVREAARPRQLRDKGFVSEDRVDRAESEAKSRQAGCDSARALAKEAEARLTPARAATPRAGGGGPVCARVAAGEGG